MEGSTSNADSTKTSEIFYCSICQRNFYKKEVIRLIFQDFQPIFILLLSIKNGFVTVKWIKLTNFHDVVSYAELSSILTALASQWQINLTYLINALESIMTTSTTIFLDFDMLKLIKIKYHLENMNPLNLHNIPQKYLSCSHFIEKSAEEVVSWYVEKYFYDDDSLQQVDSYQRFRGWYTELASIRKNQKSLVMLETKVVTENEYVVNVLFHTSDSNTGIMNMLRNTVIKADNLAPCIVRTYDAQYKKQIFHIVYKDKSEVTNENLYQLLSLLRDILLRMRINRVVMYRVHQDCSTLKSSKIIEMIKFAFRDSHIEVTITSENWLQHVLGLIEKKISQVTINRKQSDQ